ncbi:MAG: ribosome maturation factor RimM [Prevotellaceae bacterium]|jgi:16S rRNA processing protein RimM|nr:ribosome maturation factor RimM [Prevotellaceae bacterium]
MITNEEITAVGFVAKPHGIKGELSVSFDRFPFDEDETPAFIFEMDGIFVPFFIESFRFKTDTTALYKFEGIDNEEQARTLSGKTIYIHNQYLIDNEEDDDNIRRYIGYGIEDNFNGNLGKITDIEDSTKNVLFVVNNKGNELLIPAADYYITEIDNENKIIHVSLPDGLVDMDLAEEE